MITKNPSFAVVFCLFAITYFLINFVFLNHNHLISYPVHLDDYVNLSFVFDSFSLDRIRPVNYYLLGLLVHLGKTGYCIFLVFSAIFCASFAFYFTRNLLRVSLPLGWMLLYAVLVFSSGIVIDVSKSFGANINLFSIIFGLTSMWALLKGHRENKNLFFVLSVFIYTIGLFNKEDYILPILVLGGYLYCFEKKQNLKLFFFVCYILIAIFGWFLFNKYIVHNVFTGMSVTPDPNYQVSFGPSSLFHTFFHYVILDKYNRWFFGVTCLVFLGCLVFSKKDVKIKMLFLGCITFVCALPYAVLPNHSALFYAYNWLIWQVFLVAFGLFSLLSPFLEAHKKTGFILFLGISLLVIQVSHSDRSAYIQWFNHEAEINKNIELTLIKYKSQLNKENMIGVVGLDDALTQRVWAPWAAQYLQNNIGIKSKWIIFVSQNDKKFKNNSEINIANIQDICKFSQLKYLYFSSDGVGVLTSHCHGV